MALFNDFTRRAALTAAAACAVALAAPSASHAQANFEGETVEWLIPFSPGGGSDTWARFNAPFFS